MDQTRWFSPVIGTVLLVAVIAILAAVIGGIVLSTASSVSQPSLFISRLEGELIPQDSSNDDIVRITHIGGDTMQVSDMEVVVDASDACGKQGRLVNLPVPSGGNNIVQLNIEGNDIFDQRAYGFDAIPGPNAVHRSGYAVGEQIAFRITGGSCSITQEDEITVRVVHTPTNSVIIKETLTAT